MDRYGMDYPIEKLDFGENSFFDFADVVFGNLEGPISGKGRSGGTSMVFAFNEDVAPLLKKWGFDLLSIANNHAVDAGWDGRASTIKALADNDLGWCGHPSEVDADSVYYGTANGDSYAFICFHDVTYTLNDEEAVELVKEVSSKVDYLIVSIHWGYEYAHSPNWQKQIEPGRAFIDAGADFIIGHHPHVVQSFEEYNGRFIFYSLGNFIFDQYWSTETQEELAIGIVFDGKGRKMETEVRLFPMKSEKSQSRLMNDDEKSKWYEEFIGYGEYSEKMKEAIRKGVIMTGL